MASGDSAAAAAAFQAIAMSNAVGSRWNLSLDLLEWAGAETKLGNHLVAGQALYELLGLIGESGNRSELAAALGVVAHVLAELGDPDTAVFASWPAGAYPTCTWPWGWGRPGSMRTTTPCWPAWLRHRTGGAGPPASRRRLGPPGRRGLPERPGLRPRHGHRCACQRAASRSDCHSG